MTGERTFRLLTQAEVEEDIGRICRAMEAETHRYDDLAREAAETEADYKGAFARAMIATAAASRGDRSVTANEKEAIATAETITELRVWKLSQAKLAATKEALLSMRAHLDAMRSLSANIRSQT